MKDTNNLSAVIHNPVSPDQTWPDQIQYKTGTMTKDPHEMTDAQRAVWQQQCADNARAYLFSIGQPLVYRRADGRFVAEYENGQIIEVEGDS